MTLPPIDPARRCFLDIADFSLDDLRAILDRADRDQAPPPEGPALGRTSPSPAACWR